MKNIVYFYQEEFGIPIKTLLTKIGNGDYQFHHTSAHKLAAPAHYLKFTIDTLYNKFDKLLLFPRGFCKKIVIQIMFCHLSISNNNYLFLFW